MIRGVARTLEEHDFVAHEARPLIEGIARASRRLEDLVTGVLAAAGAIGEEPAAPRGPIDLREVCRDIAESLAGVQGQERIRFIAVADAQIVESSPDLVVPLLRAVIDNALKFSPSGSPVDVQARRSDQGVEVRVRDRGPGIEEGFLKEAFEPFTQEDGSLTRRHGGLGVGLFVARNLARQLGGSMELRRHPDGGTEAVLVIPETPEDSASQVRQQA